MATTASNTATGTASDPAAKLLEVRDLHVEFRTRDGVAKAVNGVDYAVDAGETLAVLGESGSGKSVTAQAVMGILDIPPGRITSGEILFQGKDLLKLKEDERRKIRGAGMAMIFQDALSSLNPVLSVGDQLGEMFVVHRGMSRKDARAKQAGVRFARRFVLVVPPIVIGGGGSSRARMASFAPSSASCWIVAMVTSFGASMSSPPISQSVMPIVTPPRWARSTREWTCSSRGRGPPTCSR